MSYLKVSFSKGYIRLMSDKIKKSLQNNRITLIN